MSASSRRTQLQVPRITQEFFPVISGPANQALALSRGLEARGIASPIITTTPGSESALTAGVTVRRFRPLIAAPNFRPSPALQRGVMRERASVIHIHGWRNPASDGAIFAAQRRGIPVVVQAHGIAFGHHYSKDGLLIRIMRQVYDAAIRGRVTKYAAAVVAATKLEADELADYGFPRSRIMVIPAGISERYFLGDSSSRPIRTERITLLMVARFARLRNLEQAIQALARLRAEQVLVQLRIIGPEVRLSIGDGGDYRQRLEQLARDLGVAKDVCFAGPRFDEELQKEYQSADIFICTSLYENFGQPIAEAAASGLPIVATPVGVAADLLGDGGAGLLAPFHDADATAAALRRLCSSRDLRLRLGAVAKQRAAAFDWRKIVPRYVELYQAVLAASSDHEDR
jgi:glycosyltransferase involved in cell wall biosynthesis